MLFHRALASEGYVIVCFDNRGTPALKGAAWRKVVYGAVGELSSKEQAAAIRALTAQRSYLDATRIAIWGWSGGGSNTLTRCSATPTSTGPACRSRPFRTSASTTRSIRSATWACRTRTRKGISPVRRFISPRGCEASLLIMHGTRRRQRSLPGHRAADQPADGAGQAVRHDGLSQSLAQHLGRAGHVASHLLGSSRVTSLEHLPAGPR